MSFGAQTGIQNHKIKEQYNLGYVDPSLTDFKIDTQYTNKVKYIAFRLMAGYCWKSPLKKTAPGWDAEAKIGISARYYTSSSASEFRHIVGYPKNDSIFIKDVSYDYLGFGSQQSFFAGLHVAFDFYIGVTKNVDIGFIRSLSMGIEGTHALSASGSSGGITTSLYVRDSYSGQLISHSDYRYASKNFGLGIRISAGLWP